MHRRAAALVVTGAVLWGTTGTAQALGGASGSPVSVGVLRLAVGACGLLLAARGHWTRPPMGWTVLAAVAMAGYQAAFFTGVARAGVALGTVVAIGSAPVLAGGLAWAVRGERPAPSWWVATPLAVAGVVLIAGRPSDSDVAGVALAATAGLAYAVYALSSKYLVEAMAPTPAMALVFTVAALLSAPTVVGLDLGWLAEPRGVVAIMWLGLGATTAAYVAFATGLDDIDVATATTLTLAEPATAALLGVLVLGERPGITGWVGMAAVVGAVAIVGRTATITPGRATTSRRTTPRRRPDRSGPPP